MSDEELFFSTRWDMEGVDDRGYIPAHQQVQIKGLSETIHNKFLITHLDQNQFKMELENVAFGFVRGKGVIREDVIAWEFRNTDLDFEGFEFYELQRDGSYLMRAEYATPDQMRTIIKGKIWEKV